MPGIDMTAAAPLAGFAISYTLLAIVPGTNFIIVTQAALSGSRGAATAAAMGVAAGAAALALVIAGGIGWLAEHLFWRDAFQSLATVLLVATGLRLVWQAARRVHLCVPRRVGHAPHFGLGLATAFTNPTTAAYLGAASLQASAAASPVAGPMLAGIVFVIAAVWFNLVAFGISLGPSRRALERCRRPLLVVSGLVLIATGVTTLPA